jgi:hypothetical protein
VVLLLVQKQVVEETRMKRSRDALGDDLDREDIERMVNDAPDIDALDLNGLKKMVLNFEKKLNQNQLLRVKFADKAEKYEFFGFGEGY